MTQPHDLAIEVLSQELHKLGGELFVDALTRKQAEMGDETAKEYVTTRDFMNMFMGSLLKDDPVSATEKRFDSIFRSVLALRKLQESEK